MQQADALRILARLKAAFPVMELDEAQAELQLREIALLHDPSVLDEAVDHLIRRDERFPTIARIRLAYRSVNDARTAHRQALEASAPAANDSRVPEWVQVWAWHRARTFGARVEANAAMALAPTKYRPPVRMRQFPQEDFDPSGPGSYSPTEYEELRQAWVDDGAPCASAVEILDVAGVSA